MPRKFAQYWSEVGFRSATVMEIMVITRPWKRERAVTVRAVL